MCAPMLGAIVGIMSSVAQFGAQMQDFNAKSEAWKTNYTEALASGRNEQAQLITRATQEEDAKNLKQQTMSIEEAQKVSMAETSAGENGVAGLSVNGLVSDLRSKAAFNRQVDQRNWHNQVYQTTQDLNATNPRIKQRINSVERPTSPSPLGMIVGIAGSMLKMGG